MGKGNVVVACCVTKVVECLLILTIGYHENAKVVVCILPEVFCLHEVFHRFVLITLQGVHSTQVVEHLSTVWLKAGSFLKMRLGIIQLTLGNLN